MASDNYNDMAMLVDNVRQLKNQQESALQTQKEQIKEFLDSERTKSNEILSEQKKIIKELKQEKHKTYSKYFFVGSGCFFLGAALATIVTFSISNWFNKELITTRNEIKIEKETLNKEQEAINKVKDNYKNFDKYINLLQVLETNDAKIFTTKQFVKNTLFKDAEEKIVGIYFPIKALSECGNTKKCYTDPNDTNSGSYDYVWIDADKQVHLTFKIKQ